MSPRSVVCLPTYNEKENIEKIASAILSVAPVDLLVVDDNSPDGTGEIADKLAQADDRISVLHREGKEGLGKAYLHAFRHCIDGGYERIIQMDADFSHPVDLLPVMLDTTERADLAIASRYVTGGGTANWPLWRQVVSRGGSFYSRLVLGVNVRDLTGGFKCWRRELLHEILASEVGATGFGFQIEMSYRALRLGFQVEEVPYIFADREQGSSKMGGGIFTEAIKLVWRLRLAGLPRHPCPHPRSIVSGCNGSVAAEA